MKRNWILSLSFLVFISACVSSGTENGATGDKGSMLNLSPAELPFPSSEDIEASKPTTGQIYVTMHDVPIGGKEVSHVYITIREVQIGSEEKGWTVLNTASQEYDLLTLVNNVAAALGKATVTPGTYDQIRLILSEDNRVVADGVEQPLKTPSGQQTGIKLDGPFTVGAGEIVTIELDFDAQKSLHWNKGQGFMLKPVITIVSVVSGGGLFGTRNIAANTGSVVALPDGAMLQIPPGALSADTEITIEKIPDSAGGSLVSNVYLLGPDGLQLNAPVLVRLPYDPSKIPAGSTEENLLLTSNFERIKGSSVDTTQKAVGADVTHFSAHFVESQKETPHTMDPGILDYDHEDQWAPYHVITVDLKEPISLKVLSGPEKEPGIFKLRTVEQLVADAEKQFLPGEGIAIAINGVDWEGDEGIFCPFDSCEGKLKKTTYVDGEEKLFCKSYPDLPSPDASGSSLCSPVGEVKFAFNSTTAPSVALDKWNSKNEIPFHWGVLGSSSTVAWDGIFGNKEGAWNESEITGNLALPDARTAIGINKTKTKLILLVVKGGDGIAGHFAWGMNFKGVYNKLREFGADRAMLLDGGNSSTLVIDGIARLGPPQSFRTNQSLPI